MNTFCVVVISREKCWARSVNRITILRSGQQGIVVRLPTATRNFNPKRPEELPVPRGLSFNRHQCYFTDVIAEVARNLTLTATNVKVKNEWSNTSSCTSVSMSCLAKILCFTYVSKKKKRQENGGKTYIQRILVLCFVQEVITV